MIGWFGPPTILDNIVFWFVVACVIVGLITFVVTGIMGVWWLWHHLHISISILAGV